MATPKKKAGETAGNKKTAGTRKRTPAKKTTKTTARKTTKTAAKSKTTKANTTRKPAAKKAATKRTKTAPIPTQDEIRERARELWIAGGRQQGDAFQNWIDAERQLYSERGL